MKNKHNWLIGPILKSEMQIRCLNLKMRKMESLPCLLSSCTGLEALRINHENLSRNPNILELIVNWRQTSDTDIKIILSIR